MSWKTFVQIVLLIIIAAVVLSGVKIGMHQLCGYQGKTLRPPVTQR